MGLCDEPKKPKPKRKFRQPPKASGLNAGHRTRTQPKVVEQWSDWEVFQPGDLAFPIDPMLTSVPSEHMIMHDTHGFIQNWYNPVCHEKYVGSDYSIPDIWDDDGVIMSFHNAPGFLEIVRSSCPFLSASELDDLAVTSEQKLTNVVGQETDLFNFLRELVEMIHGNIKILKRFESIYKMMMERYYDYIRRAGVFRWKGKRRMHKGFLSDHWLAWNFAIKPFLADLRALLCAASALQKKMEWLRKNNNRVIFRTYSKKIDLPVDNTWFNGPTLCVINKADPPESANGAYVQQLRFHSAKLEYVARAKIHLGIDSKLLDGSHMGMGALWAAYHGLTNPVAVIWEMIPFSWLIDYFLTLRARLFQTMYDFNPFQAGVKVLGFGHSFKVTYECSGRIVRNTGTDIIEHVSPQRVDYTIYRREAGLPYPGQATYFRVPSDWYRLSIIGAVGVGFLPTRRRRKSSQ